MGVKSLHWMDGETVGKSPGCHRSFFKKCGHIFSKWDVDSKLSGFVLKFSAGAKGKSLMQQQLKSSTALLVLQAAPAGTGIISSYLSLSFGSFIEMLLLPGLFILPFRGNFLQTGICMLKKHLVG